MADLPAPPYSIDMITKFTTALADAAEGADLSCPVPTCGDWTLADLVWHLTEVQDFWAFIIKHRPADYRAYVQPSRADDGQLVGELRAAAARLTGELSAADPSEPAWSWAQEQTVAFSIRRQSHEALTHSVDGLQALGLPRPVVSPELATDGVDELLAVMLDGANTSDPFVVESEPVQIRTTDSDRAWTVLLGHRGDDIGVKISEPTADAATVIAGPALDLNLWLWGRSDISSLTITGDRDLAVGLRAAVAAATQ